MQAVDNTPVLTSAVRNLWETGTNWNHLRTTKMLPKIEENCPGEEWHFYPGTLPS